MTFLLGFMAGINSGCSLWAPLSRWFRGWFHDGILICFLMSFMREFMIGITVRIILWICHGGGFMVGVVVTLIP